MLLSYDPDALLTGELHTNLSAAEDTTQAIVDRDTDVIPSAHVMGKLMDSSFRIDNSIGSLIALAPFSQFEEVEGYNPYDDENEIAGFEDYANAFIDSNSPQETAFIKQRLRQQMNDRQFVSESGAAGLFASVATGIIEPINMAAMFIPGGMVVRGGNILKTAVAFGAANAAGGILSEGALQATQETRTIEESVLNIAADALIGGTLGSAIQLVANRGVKDAIRDNVKNHLIDNDHPRSIGAAEVATTTLDQEQLAGVGLANKTLSVSPGGRLAQSPSHTARVLNQQLAENNFTFAKNEKGIASFTAVETMIKRYRVLNHQQIKTTTSAFQEYRKTATQGKKLNFIEFNEEVGLAMRRGDVSNIPAVEKAAKEIRHLYKNTKEQSIEVGILSENVKVTTADSYLPRVYKFDKILSDRAEFRNIAANWLQEVNSNHVKKTSSRLDKINAGIQAAEEAKPKAAALDMEIREAERWSGKKVILLNEIHKKQQFISQKNDIVAHIERLKKRKKPTQKQAELERKLARISKAENELQKLNRSLELLDNPRKYRNELNYMTRRANSIDRLDSSRTKLLQMSEELTAEEAEIYADEIVNKIIGAPSGIVPAEILPDGLMKKAGFTKERTFKIPDKRIEQFLESDISYVTEQYIREMAPEIELTRAFGRKDMGDQIAKLSSEYNDLIRDAKTPKEKAMLEKRRDDDVRDITAIRDRLIGTYGAPKDPRSLFVRAGRVARASNFLRLLGGMTISAIPDLARPIMQHGLRRSLKTLALMLKNIDNLKIAQQDLKEMAIGLEYTLSSRTKILADLNDPYSRRSFLERGLAWSTNKFGNWTLMNQWNDVLKSFSGLVVQSRILDNARLLSKNGSIPTSEIKKLAQLGIDESMLRRIADQFSKNGEDLDGLLTGHSHMWDDVTVRNTFQAAILKDVDSVVVTPGAGDLPLFMSSETGKLVMQFKSFIMASHSRVLISGIQQGNASFYYGALLQVSLGALVYVLKQKLAGRDVDLSPNNLVKEGLDRSGMLGWFAEAFNAAEKINPNYGLGAVFGAPPSSRYHSRNEWGALLGPTFDLTGDMLSVVNGVSKGEFDDKHIHAIRKMMPFQNLFYVAPLLNKVEEQLKK